MIVKLKSLVDLDDDARRILNNAARVAQCCAAWPTWKRNGETASNKRDH